MDNKVFNFKIKIDWNLIISQQLFCFLLIFKMLDFTGQEL
jgi:hypothetical protein